MSSASGSWGQENGGGGGRLIGLDDGERKKRLQALKDATAQREKERKLIDKEQKADQEHR